MTCTHCLCRCEVTVRLRLKRDGAPAETRFRLSPKRTSPFKSAGASVQSTTGSRGVRISDSNAGYTTFPGSVKCTGYALHSPVSPSLPLPCVTCAITFQLESTTCSPSSRAATVAVPSVASPEHASRCHAQSPWYLAVLHVTTPRNISLF